MKYIISRYNQDISWVKDYTDDFVVYDRGDEPLEGSIVVPNIGSDIYDKFTFIIDNYDNLPDVAIYTKGNLFKYITKEEFELLKDNKTFTPLLTQGHNTSLPVSFYKDNLYHEINNYWYLIPHPAKYAKEIKDIFKMEGREYNAFAPGANYILTKENILQHPKELYIKLRSYLDWTIYPGDAQLIERNLHNLWNIPQSKIIDVITFNGEHDLFEIRYNILKDYIDEFIVVEFDKTFSGKTKDPEFVKIYSKVKHFFVTEEVWSKYMDLARQSPNTIGAEHWKTEFCMKESIKDCLTHLNDDDIVFIGDCDEIVRPESIEAWKNFTGSPFKIKLDVYTYYLNNRSSEEFYGTLVSKYWHVRTDCLNHLRSNSWKSNFGGGWHFTSLKDGLRRKLTDSYTSDSYASPEVMANLESNVENNRDFLGRGFTYKIDESELPQYLKDNKQKWIHLFRA